MDNDRLAEELSRLSSVSEQLVAALQALCQTLKDQSTERRNWPPDGDGEVAEVSPPAPEATPAPLGPAVGTATVLPESPPAPAIARPGDAVRAWFSARGISFRCEPLEPPPPDDPLLRLAVELGEHLDRLQPLHDAIRATQATGRPFSVRLENGDQNTISRCVGLAKTLEPLGMLAGVWYDKTAKTLHGRAQQSGLVQNFFTGHWFEMYVTHEVRSLVSSLSYDMLTRLELRLPNGQDTELDIFCLVEGQPLWVECKTGDYAAQLNRLKTLSKPLGIGPDRLLLATLELPEGAETTIPRLYGFRATGRAGLCQALQGMLLRAGAAELAAADGDHGSLAQGAGVVSQPVAVPARLERGQLSTFLRKKYLRPVPEVLREVLTALPEVVESLPHPRTPYALKNALWERFSGLSKSQVTDALAAAVRGGALVDEHGVEVTKWTEQFARLTSDSLQELERCCRRAYLQAILTADPGWWEDRGARDEFARVIGGPPPTAEEVGVVMARIQRAAATGLSAEADRPDLG